MSAGKVTTARGSWRAMEPLVEFTTTDGAHVMVEGVDDEAGARLVSRGGTARATRTFEDSLTGVRTAAESALRVLRGGALRPDAVELEFGVKMSAEAGAVIAKGAAEAHLVVKLSWSPGGERPVPGQADAQRADAQPEDVRHPDPRRPDPEQISS
ncbi:CU044_2847 family protein [Streptomyces sp. NPDC014006]|uniref:CU044_2847 family protein n=1 Tax=Streptomyces sp. NPDC014006 TaxID=3364870 RepID=UPI003702E04A